MSNTGLIALAILIVLLAYLSASYHKKKGYFFWRTFVLAVLGFGGLALLILRMFLG